MFINLKLIFDDFNSYTNEFENELIISIYKIQKDTLPILRMSFLKSNNEIIEIGLFTLYFNDKDKENFLKLSEEEQKNKIKELVTSCVYTPNTEVLSIGLNDDYYKNIKKFFPLNNNNILEILNDVNYIKEKEKIFNNICDNKNDYSFKYDIIMPNENNNLSLYFEFKCDELLPNRINALFGKNGSGKTYIFTKLIKDLKDFKENKSSNKCFPNFSKVITITHDFSEKVNIEENCNFSFCGISLNYNNFDANYIDEVIREEYKLVKEKGRHNIWNEVMNQFLKEQFNSFYNFINSNEKNNSYLSSSQRALVLIFTKLIGKFENKSILIFDHPEIRLDSTNLVKLFDILSKLLIKFDSFCILATVEPILLQTIPSKYIQILHRNLDISYVKRPDFECFGSNINEIINNMLNTENVESNYKNILKSLSTMLTYDEVLKLFNNNLSFNALIFLKSCYSE